MLEDLENVHSLEEFQDFAFSLTCDVVKTLATISDSVGYSCSSAWVLSPLEVDLLANNEKALCRLLKAENSAYRFFTLFQCIAYFRRDLSGVIAYELAMFAECS